MKKALFIPAMGLMFVQLVSCGNGAPDAKKEADSANTAMVDSAKKVDTVSGQNNHAADLKGDAEFAVTVADGGQLEVDLGKMAEKMGTTAQIKSFGSMMVKDHTKAGKELKVIAASKNITLPDALSDKCQKKKDELAAKKGKDFDKAYADLMVNDHKETIDAFQKEADKGDDSTLKHFAQTTLPTLQHHLKMAEQVKTATDK